MSRRCPGWLVVSKGILTVRIYQFFALHALHECLEKMDGLAVAEVKGFLYSSDDFSLHTVR